MLLQQGSSSGSNSDREDGNIHEECEEGGHRGKKEGEERKEFKEELMV